MSLQMRGRQYFQTDNIIIIGLYKQKSSNAFAFIQPYVQKKNELCTFHTVMNGANKLQPSVQLGFVLICGLCPSTSWRQGTCTNLSARLCITSVCESPDAAAFFLKHARPIICLVCSLFAEQFRSGWLTTLSDSHLNGKQLLPSVQSITYTVFPPLIISYSGPAQQENWC